MKKNKAVSVLIITGVSLIILGGASFMVYLSIAHSTNLTLAAEIVHNYSLK